MSTFGTVSCDLRTLMTMIENLRGHLGAAKVQRAPSDDKIIANHIDAAYDIALRAERIIESQLASEAAQ